MLAYTKKYFSKSLFIIFFFNFSILLFISILNLQKIINNYYSGSNLNINYLALYTGFFIFFNYLTFFNNFNGDLYWTEIRYQNNELLFKYILVVAIILMVFYPISQEIQSTLNYLLFSMPAAWFAILCWRSIFNIIVNKLNTQENILFLGADSISEAIVREITDDDYPGLKIIGFIDNDPSLVEKSLVNPKILGAVKDLNYIIKKEKVKKLVVSFSDGRGSLPSKDLVNCKFNGVQVIDLHTFYEQLKGKILIKGLRPSWLIFAEGFRKNKIIITAKRIMDIVISTLVILLTLPISMIVIALIKLESDGPIFYEQQRVCKNGCIFNLFKYRSMINNAEKYSGPVWAQENDGRLTRIGKIIRKLRIDEIPQLINVLKGDMSLIGPRPERPYFVEKLKRIIPYYDQRHSIKPGITGWAAVNYSYGASIKDAMEKLQYDIYYIKNISMFLDFIIMLKTIHTIIGMKGAR